MQEVGDDAAAALLLSLEDEMHVQRGDAVRVTDRFVRLEQAVDLSLVVAGPTRVELAVADRRLEGGRRPFVQRLRRLHVVVAVDEEGGAPVDMGALGPDHRMPGPLDQLDLAAPEPAQVVAEPFGGPPAVAGAVGVGADAGDAEKLGELAEHAVLLTRDERGIHGIGRVEGWWKVARAERNIQCAKLCR